MNTDIGIDEFAELFGRQRVTSTLRKMADIELSHCRLDLVKARQTLRPFEERFGMSSEDAWGKYNRGDLGDDLDIMEWMGVYENYLSIEKQLQRIKSSRVYAELRNSTH